MKDLISELLVKIGNRVKKENSPLDKAIDFFLNFLLIFNFLYLIITFPYKSHDVISSLSVQHFINIFMITYILVTKVGDLTTSKLLDEVEEKQHELCEAVLFEPSLDKTLEEQRINDGLAAVASVDISKLSLKELQAVIDYIGDFIPQTENELKEEPIVRGYKPSKSLSNEAVKKSYKL